MDLLFQPNPDPGEIREAVACLEARKPLVLAQGRAGGLCILPGWARQVPGWQMPGWQGETFISWYAPPLGLVIVGHGAESLALVRLALTCGTAPMLLSPDERLLVLATASGARVNLLTNSRPPPDLLADPWGAVVLCPYGRGCPPEVHARSRSWRDPAWKAADALV